MATATLPGGVPIGARIHNRYRVDGHLGGGKNGEVYAVWDERQQIAVALKVLTNRPPGGWWVEAESLTALRGDYVLPILNADSDAGQPFVVTEIMTHGTTADQIASFVGVRTDRAAKWIQQAAVGVARIHDSGRLHTDLKPGNIFLDGNDNALVGDLGLSVKMDASGHGHAAGSAETMAPEVAGGGPTSVRSDVYSLGASLYQLLAGDWLNPDLKPIAHDAAATWAAVSRHKPVPIGDVAPHIPVGLRRVVMKAISIDPADRYATAAELAAAVGARTLPATRWERVPPCLGHVACFVGARASGDLKVCSVPTGVGQAIEIQTTRAMSGRRVNPWVRATPGTLTRKLRARLAAL
ncbi:MAG: serine/threonine-protein kinase [Protaetiibacter sp.]